MACAGLFTMAGNENPADRDTRSERERYWRTNKIIIASLLGVWFFVAFVVSIVSVEPLNEFKLGGFPLGFWMAHQGSIYIFIVLILIYCVLMEREDKKFHVEEEKRRDPGE